jgi:hypothetical protein
MNKSLFIALAWAAEGILPSGLAAQENGVQFSTSTTPGSVAPGGTPTPPPVPGDIRFATSTITQQLDHGQINTSTVPASGTLFPVNTAAAQPTVSTGTSTAASTSTLHGGSTTLTPSRR